MDETRKSGRVTIPTDLDVVPETLEILKKWGADAIRDCDGTDFPQQLKDADAKIYSTYYTTRKDNAWAKANPDEVQQCYIMTGFYTAPGDTVTIPLMKGISPELMQVNTNDDITRWWEVMDRTTGQPVPPEQWSYADGSVTVQAVPFHEYTVSFLAYLIWDPVHMYNATTNGWTNFEHQITFDVRQPKTHKYSMERLRKFIAEHPYVNVIRYTTFFHQFTLIFDELKREKFVDYVESVCNEFRELYENIKDTTPYCVKRVAVLNCWGKMRAWGCHMVHHALYYKQNYSYAGVIEMLSGAPFEVKFISFEDIKNDPHLLDSLDVIINVGDADTAHTGGIWWEDPEISSAIRKFVWNGGGFIGVGEPSGHPYQGHILQLATVLGVEEENGFTLNYDKYNWEEHPDHFILQDADQPVDFGEGKKNIYALEGTEVLVQRNKEVQMAAHDFGKGRAVYISGVPYSFANSRTLYRAILWSAHSEEELHTWFSSNYNVEVHAYVKNGKYCVVNNTYEPQDTTVYTTDGSSFALHLDANEIKWYEI